MMYLDLDELPTLFDRRWLWSVSRPALARFRRSHHLGPGNRPLTDVVRDLVARETGRRPQGPIRLLTNLSYFGYCFNPVSFYYCFAADGETLEYIVSEVNNTPWGERDTYVLDCRRNAITDSSWRFRPAKKMHVSPFMPMDIEYDWVLSLPAERLSVFMANSKDGRRFFDTAMTLDRKRISGWSLAGVLLRFPLLTFKVILAIHWEALRLWVKRCPLYTHPGKESAGSPEFVVKSSKLTLLDKFARRLVISRLEKLQAGQIVICENEERATFGQLTPDFPQPVQLRVLNPKFYNEIAFGGSIGAGEAYIGGHWSCDQLSDLLRILICNREVLEQVDSGLALLGSPIRKLLHALNRNTRTGSRRNIAAHYDLGNEFYRLWLDPKMMYSCAYFETPESSLEEAATAKLDRICRKLELSASDSVIEIGTGWGGFAIHAASHYGCHVTTTTISRQQYEYAKEAVADAGLEDRITLLFQDYRDLDGRFDKLVSIEMIEAVGHEFHDTFFKKCCDLLKPDGQMLLQAITIADQRYDQYRKSVDFINRYIFPGGCLTSVTDMSRTITRHTDMRTLHLEDIGSHYATTLQNWHDRFFESIDDVRELGYSDSFTRMWQFYLCYCESAFTERAIGNVQMLMMRPAARRERFSY
jgi:cyclopropane-fatty-acyl-phospholipid synthase